MLRPISTYILLIILSSTIIAQQKPNVVSISKLEIGDTLTTIMRPIQNIPQIVKPGEIFEIICLGAPNTINWQAAIRYNNHEYDLSIINAQYQDQLQRWSIAASIPPVALYELYDLVVSAQGIPQDVTKHAVQVIPEEQEQFYFVQITDTHLPTHYYYEDPQSLYDTSEMQDLREVINDINLINPTFVIITGDFINEGELEDFENRRHHTKSQRILSEFEVPVYLVAGNHDIGGWDATPPPQGTARKEWWRFFGWPWLDGSHPDPVYTQNYSFDYGQVHFIGMESYINYDGYLNSIYGDESFIPTQLEWLEEDLINADPETRVLFYHMDFADQINLSTLDIDMALYGHIHHNEGSIYSTPYNLGTDNVCSEERAFRIIKVEEGELHPKNTIYSGYSGNTLSANFYPANNGSHDSVWANVYNQQSVGFENGLLKFNMPKGNYNYKAYNGEIQQIDQLAAHAICYVKFEIPPNGNVTVSVAIEDIVTQISDYTLEIGTKVYPPNPNPFTESITIKIWLDGPQTVFMDIYNLQGKIVHTQKLKLNNGLHLIDWDGKDNDNLDVQGNLFIGHIGFSDGTSKKIRIIKL